MRRHTKLPPVSTHAQPQEGRPQPANSFTYNPPQTPTIGQTPATAHPRVGRSRAWTAGLAEGGELPTRRRPTARNRGASRKTGFGNVSCCGVWPEWPARAKARGCCPNRSRWPSGFGICNNSSSSHPINSQGWQAPAWGFFPNRPVVPCSTGHQSPSR